MQYQFGSKNQQFFSVNLHLKTMTFIYLMKYQFLNVDHFPLITVDNYGKIESRLKHFPNIIHITHNLRTYYFNDQPYDERLL